jgi:hypothetical protein
VTDTETPPAADLDAIEHAMAKATPGPWRNAWTDPDLETRMSNDDALDEVLIAGVGEPHFGVGGAAVMGTSWYDGPHVAGVQADCELICAAVNALPALLAELRLHRAHRARMPEPVGEGSDEAMLEALVSGVALCTVDRGASFGAARTALLARLAALRLAASAGEEAVKALRAWGATSRAANAPHLTCDDRRLMQTDQRAEEACRALADRLAQESPDGR